MGDKVEKHKIKGQTIRTIDEELKKTEAEYCRQSYRTFLTAPEWRNVDMAVEMAAFLQAGRPFYKYPYFSQILTFWQIFFKSLKAAHTKHSWFELIFSEYTLMNLFIGVTTSIECLAKGIFALPFRFLGKERNETKFQQHVASMYKDYADSLHHTPFFLYAYLDKIGPMWRLYWKNPKTIADTATLLVTTVEFLARSIPSLPIRWWYTQPENTEPEIIHVVVKHKEGVSFDKVTENTKSSLQEKILKRKNKKNEATLYSHMQFKRYDKFNEIMQEVAAITENDNIKIKKIAGQDEIQVDFKINQENITTAQNILGSSILYTYSNSIDDSFIIAAKIKVEDLLSIVKQVNEHDIQVKLIHDF